MKFYVAITDLSWYSYLADQKPDEVNFWRPSGLDTFRAVDPGEPFLFKLHSPRNFIVGGGFFSRFTQCPVHYAWDAFQYKNGTPSFTQFRELLGQRRGLSGPIGQEEIIGCILLQQPFFFSRTNGFLPVIGVRESNEERGMTLKRSKVRASGRKFRPVWRDPPQLWTSPLVSRPRNTENLKSSCRAWVKERSASLWPTRTSVDARSPRRGYCMFSNQRILSPTPLAARIPRRMAFCYAKIFIPYSIWLSDRDTRIQS